ncbi:hypothetical protein NLX67_19715 [Domibacillus sp. A3M-37]|uniref:hypothetical protein n=1 Tax=Domibacillus sp. A3M-37 TaxID=2962037 RepID=UPI0020B8FE45|nr:hypothetical protein [Domibacillus sp. A3M-37]MCP3764572.1 hypothetical protein [Domibacillus sp. A3M-37]
MQPVAASIRKDYSKKPATFRYSDSYDGEVKEGLTEEEVTELGVKVIRRGQVVSAPAGILKKIYNKIEDKGTGG